MHCSQNLSYTQYMLTLSLVRTDFKKLLKWGAVALAALIVLVVLFRILLILKEAIFPSPPPAPTATFGVLPKIDFPESVNKEFTYAIDTLPGDLPQLTYLTNVYRLEQRGPDILAVEKASDKVFNIGFNRRPQQVSDYVYRWSEPSAPNRVLIQDIRLNEFNLTSSFLNFEEDLKKDQFENEEAILIAAAGFVQNLGIYPNDINQEKTKIELARLDGGTIQPTTKITNANLATVYFYQNDREEVPIVYPQGKNSSMKLLVGTADLNGNALEGKFSHQNILDESATYPIKSAQQAFEELQNGDGFVASHSGDSTNVKIKEVYLALYSEGKLQEYLTPVIVFEGDNNFIAFVPAVTDEWIEK